MTGDNDGNDGDGAAGNEDDSKGSTGDALYRIQNRKNSILKGIRI